MLNTIADHIRHKINRCIRARRILSLVYGLYYIGLALPKYIGMLEWYPAH